MPSTYTVNLGIEKPATGEQSGTWGDTTNVNFDILDQAINGAERVTLTSAGSSGSPNALNITNGATSDGRNKWIEFYSSGDLGGSAYVQLVPDDAEKIVFIRNSLASSRSVLLFQGTYNSGRDLEIPAGVDMVVKFDGGGASAATVTDVFTKLRATEITTPTLTATTADINGGTIDNSVIGSSTAAAVTGTTVVANTSLNIAGDGATVTGIKDEDDMSSNSPTKLATQQSIKAYVDSQVGTVDTWAEVLANGATSGSTNPEVTAGQALKTNTINETSAGSGVTIDSVLLKDDVVNATDIETSSISANDGTAAATIANSTGNFTITNFISNSVDIGGGAIDGTNIGASSAGTGAFTTLSSSSTTSFPSGATVGTLTLADGSITDSGGSIAFGDETLSTTGSLRVGTYTTGGDATYPATGGIRLGDMGTEASPTGGLEFVAAVAGAGYGFIARAPDNTGGDIPFLFQRRFNSADWTSVYEIDNNAGDLIYFADNGTSQLFTIDASSSIIINQDSGDYDFRVESNNNANMLYVDAGNDRVGIGVSDPQAELFVRNDTAGPARLGISNAGTVAAGTSARLAFYEGNTETSYIERRRDGSGDTAIVTPAADNPVNIEVDGGNELASFKGSVIIFNEDSGDQDFRVESSGNTHMLFVDAGNDTVVIGSGSISAPSNYDFLSYGSAAAGRSAFVHGSGDGGIVVSGSAAGSAASVIFGNNWGTNGATFSEEYRIFMDGADDGLKFNYNANASTAMELASNGFVSIGGDSPLTPLHVKYSGAGELLRLESTDAGAGLGPTIGLFRNSASPAPGDNLGAINFYGEDSVSNITTYAAIESETYGVTNGSEAGRLHFKVAQSASLVSRFYMNFGETVVNESSENIDFRIESDSNSYAFFVDAGNNVIGTGTSTPATYVGSGGLAIKGATASDLSLVASSVASGVNSHQIRYWNEAGASYEIARTRVNVGAGQVNRGEYQFAVNNGAGLRQWLDVDYGGNVRFNDGGNDSDFRVESDSNANMLFVDAGNNRVGVGVGSPQQALDVNGYIKSTPNTADTNYSMELGARYDSGFPFSLAVKNNGTQFNFIEVRANSGGGSERLIFPHGNVSVGDQAAPSAKLTVSGDNNGAITLLQLRNSDSTYSQSFDFELGTGKDMTVTGASSNGGYKFNGGTNGFVINETSNDMDFRVESDANAYMFYVDAGLNAVGVGTSLGSSYQASQQGMMQFRNGGSEGTPSGSGGIEFYSAQANSGYSHRLCAFDNSGGDTPLLLQRRNNSATWSTQVTFEGANNNVVFAGTVSKGGGSFKIDHPLPSMNGTHHLVHSFVEGPQADNLYRGRVTLVDGQASVNLDTTSNMTEGTFVLLNRDVQCFTSNETGWTAVRGTVSGNTISIEAQDNTCTDTISWMVVGERHDQFMYDNEFADDDGHIIVEPIKKPHLQNT